MVYDPLYSSSAPIKHLGCGINCMISLYDVILYSTVMSLCDEFCTVMSVYDILPTPGRWIYLQQREAVLEKLNHVLHNQQQAQFRYSSDVPDDVSPTYTGLVPQGERVYCRVRINPPLQHHLLQGYVYSLSIRPLKCVANA